MSELGRKRLRAGETPSRNYLVRRRALIRAAAEVFRIKGLADTSLHDVSEAIGVDRASLYYYFGSKDQLFRAVILDSTEEVVAYARTISRGPGTARERITALITHMVSSFDHHYPALHIFVREDLRRPRSRNDSDVDAEFRRLAELADLYMSTLEDVIGDGIAGGEFRNLGSSHAIALVIQGSLNWMHRWLSPSDEREIASLAQLFVTILLDGLGVTTPTESDEGVHPSPLQAAE